MKNEKVLKLMRKAIKSYTKVELLDDEEVYGLFKDLQALGEKFE